MGTIGFSVAAPTLVPTLVSRVTLARANGRLELARTVAYAAGLALTGELVALLVAAAVLLLRALAVPPRALAPPRHP